MLEVNIGLDGVVSPTSIVLGNRWENKDELVHFDLPSNFDGYYKYIYAVMKKNSATLGTVLLPIQPDNTFYITSRLTYLSGKWIMYVICRESEMDLSADEVDFTGQPGEHVFISDGFGGTVNNNLIEKDTIDNTKLDTNLQIMYDDLKMLEKKFLDKINGNEESVITSYKDLTDKPTINGVELSGDMTVYDFKCLPIHELSAKSFSALYKAIKTTGLSQDEEDVSTFMFALTSNEVEDTFEGKFIELNIMKIYRAEFNPYTNQAIVNCDEFNLTLKAEGIVGYEPLNKQTTESNVDLSTKVDIDQGVENAGMVLVVGDDGKVTLGSASQLETVDSQELDSMLEEVFGNG